MGLNASKRLLHLGVPGVLGSLHLLLASFGAGYVPLNSWIGQLPFFEVLRTTFAGSVITRVAVVIGIALLLQAWLVLGYEVMTGDDLTVPDLGRLLAAWCAPLTLSAPLFSRDMYSYFAQGRLVAQGWDPYVIGVGALDGWFNDGSDPVWASTPSPYGSIFLAVERGVFLISGQSPFVGITLFRAVALGGLAWLFFVVAKLAQQSGIPPTRAVWLACLNPLIIMDVVSAGHNDTLMAAAVVSSFVLARRSVLLGIMCLAIGASIKPVALVALPFVALVPFGMRASLATRIVAWMKALLVGLVTLSLITVASGFGWGWLAAISAPTQTQTLLSLSTMLGLATDWTWHSITGVEPDRTFVMLTRVIGMGVGLGVATWVALSRHSWSAAKAAGVTFLVIILCAPAVHSWYVLWFLPLLAAAGIAQKHIRIFVLGIAVTALVGVASQTATTDTYLDIDDWVAVVLAVGVVAVALLGSKRERALVFINA